MRTKGTWGTVKETPRRGSGRFQASYVHGGVFGVVQGTRYFAPHIFQTKGDAGAWRHEAEELRRRMLASVPTIAAYGQRYQERDDLAASSRDRYRQLLRFYIVGEPATITRRGMVKGKPVVKVGVGDIRINELSRADVRVWWQGLPVKTRESSCRQAYDLLRALLNAAVEDELIDVNPVRVKAAARAQASRERDIDPLPIDVLYAVADAMPPRWRLGALLGGVLGLRSGEVRALQRHDFNLKADFPTLKVERSVKQAEGTVELGPLKTARRGVASRTLPIPAALVDDVQQHLRAHAQLRGEGLLFWRQSDGGPVRSSEWLKAFKKACTHVANRLEAQAQQVAAETGHPESEDSQRIRRLLTGKGGYVFHGTRVTGLTWAYRLSGGNLRAVQAMGGHTSPRTNRSPRVRPARIVPTVGIGVNKPYRSSIKMRMIFPSLTAGSRPLRILRRRVSTLTSTISAPSASDTYC